MKKRIILFTLIIACLTFLFAIGVSAATTNEFGTLETSTTIDLTGMSTDTKARVVLFDGTEYHTYPSQYIVKNAGDIAYDFTKINTDFGKEYGVSSVIRIEIPNTVKVIVSGLFNYGKNNNLKEVYFPADSQVYKFNWGCFEQNTGLEKINIPASLTEYHGTNHFAKCSSLKYITFDEGYSVSAIPTNFLQSCSSLEELVFPNSVTQIGSNAFASCGKLKKVVFGAKAQVMLPSSSDCGKEGSTWYIPATFYASNVTTEPESNMFHHQGKENNGNSGNTNNPKNITFVYTGTYEEALALRARCKAADQANGENCVGLKRLWDATLCTEAEYKELTGKNIGESATGNYLIYGYNECKAFYEGEHSVSTTKNEFEGEAYITPYKTYARCTRCEAKTETGTVCDALFTYKGFSTDGESIVYDIKVNKEAIEFYNEATNDEFKYGIVVSQIYNDGVLLNNDGSITDNKVLAIKLSEADFVSVQVKILNIADSLKTTPLHCCAYIVDGGKVKYIYDVKDENGQPVVDAYDTANQVSYSQIAE